MGNHYTLIMHFCRFYSNSPRNTLVIAEAGRIDEFSCFEFVLNRVSSHPERPGLIHVQHSCTFTRSLFADNSYDCLIGGADGLSVTFQDCVFSGEDFGTSGGVSLALVSPKTQSAPITLDAACQVYVTYPASKGSPIPHATKTPDPSTIAFRPSSKPAPSAAFERSALAPSHPIRASRAIPRSVGHAASIPFHPNSAAFPHSAPHVASHAIAHSDGFAHSHAFRGTDAPPPVKTLVPRTSPAETAAPARPYLSGSDSSLVPLVAGIGGALLAAAVGAAVLLKCRKTTISSSSGDDLTLTEGVLIGGESFEDSTVAGEYLNPVAETVVGTELMWEAGLDGDKEDEDN
jgi:hypothetical protein